MSEVDIKIVLVGETNVGKTCIVRRVTSNVFDNTANPTLGAGYSSKHVTISGTDVHLQIWDTAGTERYRGMAPMYYREAKAALVCFSIVNAESFEKVDYWASSLKSNLGTAAKIFLVGNKADLAAERVVSETEAEVLATEIGAESYVEVSAKTGEGVFTLFETITKTVLAEYLTTELPVVNLEPEVGKGKKSKKKCCE